MDDDPGGGRCAPLDGSGEYGGMTRDALRQVGKYGDACGGGRRWVVGR